MLVLIQVQEEMRNGQVALEKYVITKTLTKPPEAYPDAKNQPHVLVSTVIFYFILLNDPICVLFILICSILRMAILINIQVAQRLKQQGYTSGCSVGDTIPYVICCEQVCHLVLSIEVRLGLL